MPDVICPSCGGIYHETTKLYDPGRVAHGAMFRLKKKYREWGWGSFPADPAIRFADLECPSCGGCYVGPNGRLLKEVTGQAQQAEVSAGLDLAVSDLMPKDIGVQAGASAKKTKERDVDQATQGETAEKTGTAKAKRKKKGKK